MKKRIFALLLCVVMLASMIPLMGASVSDNGGTGTVAVSPAAADVSEDRKAVITAAGGDGAYQWQIYAGNDVWANIAGQTGAQLTVSYGMVCGLMEGGKAYVRCRVTNGGNEAYSSPVDIVIAGNEEENSGRSALFALLAPRTAAVDEPVGTVAADEPVGTVVREAYVLGEPVITLPGAATPAPTATPAAEATPAPAEDTDEAPAEEPTPAPDAEAPAEDGAEAEPSPAPAEEAAPSASPAAETAPAETPAAAAAPVAESAEENTAAPAQDAEAAPTAARSISAPALRLAPLRRFSDVDTDEPAATDAPAATPNTYYITINYFYGDEENAGKQAANPWTANIAAGSSYSATVVSPAIVGYAPDHDTFTVDVTNIDRNVTYTVYYYPSEVSFTVRHYQQNTDNDNYTLVDTEPKTGLTNAQVGGNLAKEDYEGFYSLLYDGTVRIAADGSTVIDIKYDRYYYLLNFNLDGGYGVEPIYARYGAPVSVGTPAKAGYTFAGWDQELPATVPAKNVTYKALWTIGDQAKVTVVIWGENADDEKYSFYGNSEIQAKPGTTLTKDDLTHILICDKEEHQHTNSCMNCAHTHTADCYGAIKQEQPVDGKTGSATENINQFKALTGGTLKNGMVYRVKCDGAASTTGYDKYYLYYDNTWYLVSSSNISGSAVASSKKVNAHKHSGNIFSGNDKDQFWVYNSKLSCTHTHTVSCYICGKEEHTHGESCYTSPLDMDATLWKLVKSDEITVAADGTSIINVYYDRKEFTLHFREAYSGRDDYGTITAKWGANIRDAFNAKCTNAGTSNWSENRSSDGPWTSYLDIMPATDRTYYAYTRGHGTSTAYYYVEGLDGDDKLFYTNTSTGTGYVVTVEEFIEITGFTFDAARSTKVGEGFDGAVFYYTRNSYTLKFYNYNGEVTDKSRTVKYEAPLGSYYFEPDYPAGLEPNAYEFAGWYTTAGCYDGSEADLSTMKMPASDLILYAKWTPKTHKVTTWLTVDMKYAVNVGDSNEQTVPHGGKAEAPETPTRGNYTFVGWFYKENGTEKAFDFSMPVNRDLDLYAKWSSNKLVEYTIKYQLEDNTTIAPDTAGSALAGTTKTFDAKAGNELNESYRTGYYPKTNSHSMVMNIDGGNEFIFYYVAKEKVPYTVRYLEKGTNIELAESKTVETTAAVVTETFVPIAGYRPDAYQKRLVLSATESENVIIFYYEKDEVHAPVQVIHWTQNIAGVGYTEYQSSTNLDGVIGNDYSETQLTIPGFVYNASPEHPVDGYPAQASGKLTDAGLVLNLYYDRIEYPYEFRFLEQGKDKELAEPVTGTARYQAQVTEKAKEIPGYTLVSTESQSIIIDIEDGTTAVKNVKTFYYTEQTVDIKYEVVGPTGCGTLDNYQENQLKVINGEVKGSLPTAVAGFKFVGWYKDETCNDAVDKEWVKDDKLTPEKTKNYGTEADEKKGYEAATYYAKFEDDVAQLTITKQGAIPVDENQSFVFTVTGPNDYRERVVIYGNGSVTIKNLKPGTYTVTEEGWSWRYTGYGSIGATISALEPGNVIFTNVRQTEESHSTNGWKWLGGDAYKLNSFN